jgi:hypothetical protein
MGLRDRVKVADDRQYDIIVPQVPARPVTMAVAPA